MNISKINAFSPVAFQGSTATKAPARTIKVGQKEIDVKKAGAALLGLTAAGITAFVVINKIRQNKANAAKDLAPVQETIAEKAQELVSSLAQTPVEKGEKFSMSATAESQKLVGLINTAKIEGEIAEVEARLAKHDELQKMYEELFTKA